MEICPRVCHASTEKCKLILTWRKINLLGKIALQSGYQLGINFTRYSKVHLWNTPCTEQNEVQCLDSVEGSTRLLFADLLSEDPRIFSLHIFCNTLYWLCALPFIDTYMICKPQVFRIFSFNVVLCEREYVYKYLRFFPAALLTPSRFPDA